jgi:hypothetical protein
MRIARMMTKAHWLGIVLGVAVGVLVLNVLLPRLPGWLGLAKKKPPVPFVISGDY